MKQSITSSEIILEREKIIAISQKSLDRSLNNVKYFQELIKEQRENLESFKKTIDNKYGLGYKL